MTIIIIRFKDKLLAKVALEQTVSKEILYVLELVDLAGLGYMYKEGIRELGGHTPERVHTYLKNMMMSQVENLRELKTRRILV
jgi:hypothetical protein